MNGFERSTYKEDKDWEQTLASGCVLDISKSVYCISLSLPSDHENRTFTEISVDFKKYLPFQANFESTKWDFRRQTCGEESPMDAHRKGEDPVAADLPKTPNGTSRRILSESKRWLQRDSCLLDVESITDFNTLRRKWSMKAIHDRFYGMTADCKMPLLRAPEEDKRVGGLRAYKSAFSVSVDRERSNQGLSPSVYEGEADTPPMRIFCVHMFLVTSIAIAGVYEFFSNLQRLDIVN